MKKNPHFANLRNGGNLPSRPSNGRIRGALLGVALFDAAYAIATFIAVVLL